MLSACFPVFSLGGFGGCADDMVDGERDGYGVRVHWCLAQHARTRRRDIGSRVLVTPMSSSLAPAVLTHWQRVSLSDDA